MLPTEVKRRDFLKWAIAGLSALIAGVFSAGSAGYILSPLFRKKEENWIDIGPASGFEPGSPTKIEYIERRHDAWVTHEQRSSAWVYTPDGKEFSIFDPRCTHLGCPYRWNADKKQFVCPCHNGIFHVTGKVLSGPPPRPLDRYAFKVSDGRLFMLPRAGKAIA